MRHRASPTPPPSSHRERISFQEYYVQLKVVFMKRGSLIAQCSFSKVWSHDCIRQDMLYFLREMWLFFRNPKFKGPCVQQRVWTRRQQQVGGDDCRVESSEAGGLVWSRPSGAAPLSSWLPQEAQDGPGVAEPQRLADLAGSLHHPAFLTDTPALLCLSLQEKWKLSTCWPARPPTGTSAVSG